MTVRDRYDVNKNNFPNVPESEYESHQLKQLEDQEVPGAVEQLVEAVNESWERMQAAGKSASENVHMYTFHSFDDIDNYAATHAHEVLAHLHEGMQSDDLEHPANWFYRHGGLLRAYVEVFEPSETKKGLISYLHKQDPDASPFQHNPYPSVTPNEREIRFWKRDVKHDLERMDKFQQGPEYYEHENY
ncbi:hypothetical protein [Halovivax cerinus]|uniref:Uncharacterized protein n=1 Tax=Halovivax cerinus TaxID=1487865 RepID=A0ABD5NQX2_9EURY|nr:hypothetical protein [Halovivax cerinus]